MMTEAELLNFYAISRGQLDLAITQVISLNFALLVAIYYFLHRSGRVLRLGVFVLYCVGCYVFLTSGTLAAVQTAGALKGLKALADTGDVSAPTEAIIKYGSRGFNQAYVYAVNAAVYMMFIGCFAFLFFWKPKGYKPGEALDPDAT